MNAKAATRSIVGNEDNTSRRINASAIADLKAEEVIEILEADKNSLLRRFLAIRRPQDLSDAEHRAAVAQAWEGEHGPRPPPWNDAGPEDADPSEVAETLLLHLDFVDGDAVARGWWWERTRWLKRCHSTKARAVGRALDQRRGK